jgi:phosphoserine phosphatase
VSLMVGRRLVFFDVDGTLTIEKSIWQYLLEKIGRWRGAGEVNLEKYRRGAIDYDEFCRLDAQLFKFERYSELRKIAFGVPKYNGLDRLFAFFTQRGYTICLLSTGLKLLTDYFTERYRIELCFVNDIAAEADICTGEPIINVWEGQKGLMAGRIVRELQPEYVVAFGDSRGDIPVFEEAHFSIGVNVGDAGVRAAASLSFTGWDYYDLDPLLEQHLG